MPRALLLLGLLALGAPEALAQFGPSPVEDTWEERKRKALADMSPAERARYDDFLRRTGDPAAAERYAVEMEELYDRIDEIERRKGEMTPEQYRREREEVYRSMNGVLQTEMDPRTRELYLQVLRPDLEQAGYPGLPKPDDPNGPYAPPDIADMDERQREEYYRRALEEARRELAKDPTSTAALLKQAGALAELGDWAGAVSAADRVLAKDPKNANALALIKLSAGRGGPSSADPGEEGAGGGGDFQSLTGPGAVQGPGGLAPDLREAADRLERAMRIKDHPGALRELNALLAKDPKLSVAYAQRAEVLLRLRRFAEAEKDIEETLRRGVGGRANWERLRRLAREKLDRYRAMKEAAQRALQADPKSAKAYHDLAHAEAGLGDRAAMVAALREAAKLDGAAYGERYRLALKLPDEASLLALFDEAPAQAQPAPAPPSFPVPLLLGGGLVAGALVTFFLFRRRLSSAATTGSFPVHEEPSAEPEADGRIPTGYRVLRQIGSGGMGTVYEAEDVSLQRRVAIKRMREEIRSDPRERERFLTEARLVAKLKHESIIEIYGIIENEGELYLVFEFIDGRTLDQFLAEKPLTPEQARSLARQACAALAYAHGRGVIHRDLKPSNIMITGEGRIKVMDFGIARQAKDFMDKLSMTNTVAGTPQYMAPESEQGVVRVESDLYSLAIVLYEALCGEHPFAGIGAGILLNKLNMNFQPPSRRRPGLPPALDAFFARALQAEPDRRPRTASEFASAFDAALFGPPKT